MSAKIEISGQRFGRWSVSNHAKGPLWSATCDCGAQRLVDSKSLRSGKSRSCIRCAMLASKSRKIHGGRQTRLYRIWCGMKARCYRNTEAAYPRYGGRGIVVCQEWRGDFSVFSEWARSNGYSETLTLDRINNDGNYEPDNCRWATYAQQNRNYSRNVIIEVDGRKEVAIDAAERAGIKPHTLRQRIKRYGLSPADAIAAGPGKRPTFVLNGETVLVSDASRKAGLPTAMVMKRLRRGWSPEKAVLP